MAARLTPTNIQPIGAELAIAWNDGAESYLPLETLRRACPCAACGGEPDVLGNVDAPAGDLHAGELRAAGCQVVGGYALQPAWGDGHGSGLYTFPYLRRLAGEAGAPPST